MDGQDDCNGRVGRKIPRLGGLGPGTICPRGRGSVVVSRSRSGSSRQQVDGRCNKKFEVTPCKDSSTTVLETVGAGVW